MFLTSKVEFGPITFHYVVDTPTTTPEKGLPFEPRSSDYIMHNGLKFEVNGWDLTTDETEYRVHCNKIGVG